MTDPIDLPDIYTPVKDRGHEAIRLAVVGAIADVRQAIAGINQQIDALNTRADAAEIREQTLQADIDALQQRVAQLDPPSAP